jgi:uncharacterized protein (DUF488 family)
MKRFVGEIRKLGLRMDAAQYSGRQVGESTDHEVYPLRMETTLYTIGHSTHAIEAFLNMLRAYSIEVLVDVRTVPRSRHNPQFEQESLRESTAGAGIEYRHMKSLGGLRHASVDSVNTGWRNASFRGFADYMQTPEFARAIDDLVDVARSARTAIMCAEAVPWRCHRSLISDALLARGIRAIDIMSAKQSKPHELTSFARIDGIQITYPAAQAALPLEDC